MTNIEWTKTENKDGSTTKGETWNPIAGCDKISDGCKHCYAIKDAHRLAGNPNPKIAAKYEGTTKIENGKMNWTGRINFASEDVLLQPMRWTRPRKIFVNSMSDLFHESVPDEWIDKIFAVMALSKQHTFQVLTKRPERMRDYFTKQKNGENRSFFVWGEIKELKPSLLWKNEVEIFPRPNIHLGVSVENQKEKHRIETLRDIPAAIRFLSLEPLLENLGDLNLSGIDWVIVGGESGNGARLVHPDWIKSLRDQCVSAGVPFFFKQWGNWFPIGEKVLLGAEWSIGKAKALSHIHLWNDDGGNVSVNIGKKNAGRFLNGRTWDEFPKEKNR